MAGNALCEVVVCAEEDLRMLEDELGRIDGKLSPCDPEGPAGRVSSSGYYGSEIMAMPTGTMTNTLMMRAAARNGRESSQPRVLENKEVTRIPRSPTVRFLPQSASKLGVDGNAEYTPSSEGSAEARERNSAHRVNDLLIARTDARAAQQQTCRWPHVNKLAVAGNGNGNQAAHDRTTSLLEKLRESVGLESVGAEDHKEDNNNQHASKGGGGAMGLVAWQRLNSGAGTPQPLESPRMAVAAKRDSSNSNSNSESESNPSDLTAYNKPYDPTHTQSADQPQPTLRPAAQHELQAQPQPQPQGQQQVHVPGSQPPMAWRNSWDPAYGRGQGLGQGLVTAHPATYAAGNQRAYYGVGPRPGSYGLGGFVQPQYHLPLPPHGGAGLSATASNTALFKEVQDRAAALARANGRWLVGGAGLTNYNGASGRPASAKQRENKKRGDDPFA
jgi:hypothetical protein